MNYACMAVAFDSLRGASETEYPVAGTEGVHGDAIENERAVGAHVEPERVSQGVANLPPYRVRAGNDFRYVVHQALRQ